MDRPEIADRTFTIRHYLERSSRDTLPLERGFVQRRVGNNRPAPGPLAEFVRRSRESALEQYLLAHAVASGEEHGRFDVRLGAPAWARMVGGWFDPQTGKVAESALHAVSRNWRLVEDLQLVERERVGRRARITLLADDGTGTPYRHVGAGAKGKKLDAGKSYLQLPYAYWFDGWHERLSLAAKAVLLIALSLGDGFPLPYARIPEWYGISASTGERGLGDLHAQRLVHREQHRRPDPESPVGFSDVYYYELLPPFGPRGQRSSQAHWLWMGPRSRVRAGSGAPAPAPAGGAAAADDDSDGGADRGHEGQGAGGGASAADDAGAGA